jgi:hypothetical protein
MDYDRLRNSGLVQAVTDLFADLAELLQKELQLAKTEVTEKIVSRCAPACGWWSPACWRSWPSCC